MAKRPSSRPDVKQAVKVVARKAAQGDSLDLSDPLVTVSYNLPANLVDLLRRLARQRADDTRAAKARGEPVEGDARTSASKIILDALAPHIKGWRKDLGE